MRHLNRSVNTTGQRITDLASLLGREVEEPGDNDEGGSMNRSVNTTGHRITDLASLLGREVEEPGDNDEGVT